MMAGTENKRVGRGLPWRMIGWGGAALLLLMPLVTGAPWGLFDYLLLAALLGGAGLGLELAARKGSAAYRMGAGLALATGVLLLIVNGAVGIIGSEHQEANLLFLGVVALALLAALAAMFRPKGMALAMGAAALAQLSVPVIAMLLWPEAPVWAPEVVGSTILFAGMWLASAALFRKAAASVEAQK
jgi:hypothetical protein